MKAFRCMIKTRKSDKRGYGMAHACGLMVDDDDDYFDAGACGGGGNGNHHYHFKCHNF